MTQPGPEWELPAGPLTLTQAMALTKTLFKYRFGTFATLAFAPPVLSVICLLLAVVGSVATMVGAGQLTGGGRSGVVGTIFVAFLIAMIPSLAIRIKAASMLTLLAHETAQGRRPSYGQLIAGTRGSVRRSVAVLLLVAATAGVVAGAVVAVAAALWTALQTEAIAPRTFTALALGGVLLAAVVTVGALYVITRLVYWYPCLTIERRSGWAAARDSWHLTCGSFWRTRRLYGRARLALSATGWILTLLSGLIVSAAAWLHHVDSPFAGAATALTLLLSAVLVVHQSLAGPAMTVYATVMYLDRTRND